MSRARHILVVDDEPGVVRVLCAVLEDAGYRTESAGDGVAALELARTSTPDVVLLDYVMPRLDGSETLRLVRKDAALSKVPVVMMSGVPESMVQRRSRGGYDAFLRKPFGLDDLLDVVAKLLAKPRKPAAKRRTPTR